MVTSVAAYLAGLALLGLERLAELSRSRRNARRAFARGGVEVGRGHFRVMAVVHALFLASCAVEALVARPPFPGALGLAALAVALCAQALRAWAIATLGERWNVRIIVWPGAPPITAGPYRYLRHPNYLAVVLEIAAVPMVHGAHRTALAFSIANAAILAVRIRAEEAALGRGWAEAFATLPRLIPGGRPSEPS
jgi:methyltransferase